MGWKEKLKKFLNEVPPGAVREGGADSILGIPFQAMFGRTSDVWQAKDDGPVEWWSHVEEIFEYYHEQVTIAGDMIRNQWDPEIWKANYEDKTPEQVIYRHGNDGGIKALKTVRRIRPGDLWREHGNSLREDEAPVMMLANNYGELDSRISVGAWEGNTPLILVSDELMQNVLFDTAFVESLDHKPNEKLGFRITPGRSREVWDDNLSIMSAKDVAATDRLNKIAERDADYREHQLIEVCDLARVAKENPSLFRQLCGLAILGKRQGGVGIAATMTPAEAINWSERGSKLQKDFLNSARFIVGTVLDAVTATQLGKTLAPRVEMNPEDLAEKLLYAGGSQVVFVDDNVVEMGWLIG